MAIRRTLLLLPLALLLGACGGASTIDPVAAAADATKDARTAKVSLRGTTSAPGLAGSITVTGGGAFDLREREGSVSLDIGGFPEQARQALGGTTLHIDAIFENFVVYMRFPAAVASRLPGGKPWVKLDVGRAGRQLGLDLQSLSQTNQDPTQALDYLRATTGELEDLGSETVRGAETTHYRGKVDLRKVAGAVPEKNRAAVRRSVEQLIRLTGTRTIPMDVWIEKDSNLLRRLRLAYSIRQPGTQQRVASTFTEEFYDFGSEVDVKAPPANQTTDIASLLGR